MEGGRPLTGSAKVLYMSKSESLLNHSFSSIFLGGMDHESLWLLLMIWFSQKSHLFLVPSSYCCDGSACDMRVASSEAAQPISTSWRRQVPPIPRRPGDPWWTLGWFFFGGGLLAPKFQRTFRLYEVHMNYSKFSAKSLPAQTLCNFMVKSGQTSLVATSCSNVV